MGVWEKQAKPQMILHKVAFAFIQHLWFQHVRRKMQIKPLLLRFGATNGHHLFTRIQVAK
jgi:hypothetical protein